MNKAIVILFSILGVIILLGIIVTTMAINTYNEAIFAKNDIDEKWEDIGIRLEQRYETMSILIDSIHDANQQVEDLLEMITDARAAILSATNPDELSEAEGDLEGAFEGLRIIIEDNPDTYSTVGLYTQYMNNATASTNAVSFARQAYNDSVIAFRNLVQSFPGNIILGMFGFSSDTYDLYQAQTPEVPTF